jgi:hypothetical protein
MLLAIAGCAGVSVTKVSKDNAECLDGFRYYLPRPYVLLKKPAPIAGDQFVVAGTIDSRGYLVVNTADLPDHVKYHFPMREGGKSEYALIPETQTLTSDPARAQSTAKGAETQPRSSAEVGSKGELDPAGAVVEVKESDIAIVYLPDFEEQYSIKYTAGLGRITTGANGLRLRHGWMLENISLDIDNTKLGEFIFNQIDKFTDVAAGLISGKKDTAGFKSTAKERREGANVTLRITYSVIAQKGIYPVLKPSERATYLELCGTGAGEAPPTRRVETRPAVSAHDWVFMPYPPFTVIAFNVKREIVVEVLSVKSPSGGKPDDPEKERGIKEQAREWVIDHLPDEHSQKRFELDLTGKEGEEDWIILVEGLDATAAKELEATLRQRITEDPPEFGKGAKTVVTVRPAPK